MSADWREVLRAYGTKVQRFCVEQGTPSSREMRVKCSDKNLGYYPSVRPRRLSLVAPFSSPHRRPSAAGSAARACEMPEATASVTPSAPSTESPLA